MSVLINFRIDEKLKKSLDKVCDELGITMSAAFNMFAKDLVKNRKINFSLDKKLGSGISMKKLYDKLDSISGIKKDSREIDDNYYVNKVGNIIMLVPKDNPWEGVFESSGQISDDFMSERVQSDFEERDTL